EEEICGLRQNRLVLPVMMALSNWAEPLPMRRTSMSVKLNVAPAIRFHLSLNVSDLARSIDFYRLLFGVEPAKRRGDYAKFELDDPPLVLSLEPTPRAVGGPPTHLAFRLPDT